jgi:hypothetical protein
LRPALEATINKQREQTNEEMTMTVTGGDNNVEGEGRDDNDYDCGSTSADNKQQST